MAKNKISEYSATAASNTDVANINIAEGCSPSNVNNAIRGVMAHLKDFQAGNVAGNALAIAGGGTGAESASAARTNLGLGALAVLDTVDTAQIDDDAITTAKILDDNVTTAKIPDDAITTAKILDANVTVAKLENTLDLSSKTVTLPAGVGGKLLQVQTTNKNDVFTTTTVGSYVDVTGMSVTITPASTSNKILVTGYIALAKADANDDITVKLLRDSTSLGDSTGFTNDAIAHACGYPSRYYEAIPVPFSFVDSPNTTSAVTYKIQIKQYGGTTYVNRRGIDLLYGSTSTITATEISG